LVIPRLRADDLAFNLSELMGNFPIVVDVLADLAFGVEDCGVIASAEVAAYFFEAIAGVPARQEHADLTWERHALVAFLALQVAHLDVVVLGHCFEDLLDGDPLLIRRGGFADGRVCGVESRSPAVKSARIRQ